MKKTQTKKIVNERTRKKLTLSQAHANQRTNEAKRERERAREREWDEHTATWSMLFVIVVDIICNIKSCSNIPTKVFFCNCCRFIITPCVRAYMNSLSLSCVFLSLQYFLFSSLFFTTTATTATTTTTTTTTKTTFTNLTNTKILKLLFLDRSQYVTTHTTTNKMKWKNCSLALLSQKSIYTNRERNK